MGSLWLLWLWVPLGLAEEETLLDTRLETSDLHWTVHPPGEGQWEELSALDAELGGAVRTFEVCSGRGRGRDSAQNSRSPAQNSRSPAQNSWSPAQNSWLRSRWVPRGAATTVMAELRFTVMACDSLPPAAPPRPCKETFTVFYHESDADTATATHPPWMENPYVKVDTVAAEHLSRPGSGRRGRVNRKVLRLGPLSRAGFYLAFQDLGACMALLSVRLFFRRCPAATARLARFPAAVPAELVAAVAGRCVAGAVPAAQGRPLMYCREDGRWAQPPALGCVCGPGMEPDGETGCRQFLGIFGCFLGGFWVVFGWFLGGFWVFFGWFLGVFLGVFWVFFGGFWVFFGGFWVYFWWFLCVFWVFLGGFCVFWVFLGGFWVFFWWFLGGFLGVFWVFVGGFWVVFWVFFGCFLVVFLGVFWVFFGGFLGGFWGGFFGGFWGGFLGCFMALLGSPSDISVRPPFFSPACPPETFKAGPGGGGCLPCPPQSEAPAPGAASCRCRAGFLRGPGEGPPEPCSAPPSAPRALAAEVNGSGVRLSWSPPRAGGDRGDLRYNVGCRACPPPRRGAPPRAAPAAPWPGRPPPEGLRTPAVSVAGLRPRVTYSFRVTPAAASAPPPGHPENNVPGAEINVTAGADVPGPVVGVARVGAGPGGVTLTWPRPPAPPGPPVLDYEVKFYEKLGGGEGPPQFLTVPGPRAELGGLRRGGLYGVRVRARAQGGYGDFGPEITVSAPGAGESTERTPEISRAPGAPPGGVVAAAAALGGLLVLALLGGALAWLRRGRLQAEKRRQGPAPGGLGGKLYIDPLTYEDPEVALRDFAQEIDVTCVTIEEVIGAGEFGEVWRGRLSLPGQPEAEVAVKTLKGGAGERQRREFLREAARMGQFRHPNVLRLRGVVSAGPPAMIVTEFLLHGALDAFLRGREGTLPPLQLVAMLRGIAAGMRYLSEAGFVHRDLAARNILVDAHLVCKVSDFGLSRALEGDRDSDPTYTSSLGGKIPIRWTAPEAIAFRTFTSASDAWSYGIVMWEVLSFGERPYWDMSNQDVINAIEQDYRLPPPPRCPPALHHLMLQCWQRPRHARPTFPQIVHALDRLIRRPESLRPPPGDTPSSAPTCPEQRDPPGLAPQAGPAPPGPSAGAWPRAVGGYQEPFGSAGVTGMELLPHLSREDLLRMGVTLGGQKFPGGAQSPPKGDAHC
ncbi:LOW QUALITY PROTEIN: ephrin type-B receptor 4 [Chamaea fasciata]|uniref:LOW QUALITY PROTEIN: ephrin type-B receptor 4 n=1 Tax=Chamaea fasciata TaxID=190680 RepID=UPI00336AC7A1